MPIAVVCPSCKAKLKAPDTLIGKTVKCPGCANPVLVEGGNGVSAPAAPARAPAPAKKPAPSVAKQPAPPAKKPAAKPPKVEEPIEDVAPVEEVEEVAEVPADEEGAERPPVSDSEKSTAMWIHLLPLVLGCCGGIGTFISLFFWISKRKESPFIDHHGKTWLNFAINLFVVGVAVGILSGVLGIVAGLISSTLGGVVQGLFGLLLLALAGYACVMAIMAGLKAKKGEWFEYHVAYKVLK